MNYDFFGDDMVCSMYLSGVMCMMMMMIMMMMMMMMVEPAKKKTQVVDLIGRGEPFGRPLILKTPPKYLAGPRDYPIHLSPFGHSSI